MQRHWYEEIEENTENFSDEMWPVVRRTSLLDVRPVFMQFYLACEQETVHKIEVQKSRMLYGNCSDRLRYNLSKD